MQQINLIVTHEFQQLDEKGNIEFLLALFENRPLRLVSAMVSDPGWRGRKHHQKDIMTTSFQLLEFFNNEFGAATFFQRINCDEKFYDQIS